MLRRQILIFGCLMFCLAVKSGAGEAQVQLNDAGQVANLFGMNATSGVVDSFSLILPSGEAQAIPAGKAVLVKEIDVKAIPNPDQSYAYVEISLPPYYSAAINTFHFFQTIKLDAGLAVNNKVTASMVDGLTGHVVQGRLEVRLRGYFIPLGAGAAPPWPSPR